MTIDRWREQAERLRELAADVALPLARSARSRTTLAQERAILRMFGVDGLDRAGRPLASSVVEAYCGERDRLESGIAMPFAAALNAYDAAPRELALDVAAGHVDLAEEAASLGRPEIRAAASATVASLMAAAAARFDQNKTAARELRDVLGEPGTPWLGVTLASDQSDAAEAETGRWVALGAGLVRVRVPASWELLEASTEVAAPDGTHRVRPSRRHSEESPLRSLDGRETGGSGGALQDEETPAGSQRGLARIRIAADEAAAARGTYASMMTVSSAFAAPEQAIVAAFERVDFVEADPMREIVEGNVDPDRALADHAFAHRIHVRSGCRLFIGSGPLALGPEVATGMPAGRATRAGRSLALQALGVEIALANGLAPDRLVVGAVPEWVAAGGDPLAVLVEAWLRKLVFAGHPLALAEPPGAQSTPRPYELVAALVALSGGDDAERSAEPGAARVFLRQPRATEEGASVPDVVAAASSARAIGRAAADGLVHGSSGGLGELILTEAITALERFASNGWSQVLGPEVSGEPRLGATAVAQRRSGADPLAPIDAPRAATSWGSATGRAPARMPRS